MTSFGPVVVVAQNSAADLVDALAKAGASPIVETRLAGAVTARAIVPQDGRHVPAKRNVVVLGLYFGWTNPWMYFFSLATAVGGAFWAWLYNKTGSIYGPWASHLLIDAAIFAVGYDLIRTATSAVTS